MPQKTMDELSLEYIAGFFDGEGCVNMTRSRKTIYPRVLVVNTDLGILELLQARYGGDIKPVVHRRKNWKPSWIWRLSWKRAIDFLCAIEPYLLIKHEQAVTAICWYEARPDRGEQWDKGSLDLLTARMKWLNRKGPLQGEDPIEPVLREIKTGQCELEIN